MTLDEAIKKLKKTVKFSAIPGQRHIDLTLVPTSEKAEYEEALKVVHKAIFDQEISQEDFEIKVGLVVS